MIEGRRGVFSGRVSRQDLPPLLNRERETSAEQPERPRRGE